MRFELSFEFKGNGPFILPVNYQYPLSAWIYKVIHHGDNEFAGWLHEKGYMDKTRQYKLFTYSQLNIDQFSIDKDRLKIHNPKATLQISFFANEAAEPFIKGLFTQQLGSIGDQKSRVDFSVNQISRMPEPVLGETMIFKTLSPVIISKTQEDRTLAPEYLHPEDKDFARIMHDNLVNKYTAWMMNSAGNTLIMNDANGFEFKTLSPPKSRLITIKANTPQQTRIRGYTMKFSLKTSLPLLKMGYYAGFGEKNSLGFGCVGVV
jgi:CRISPR-associated endoribonuclease Cas6